MNEIMKVEIIVGAIHPMFKRATEKIEQYRGGYVYVVFGMGSVKLDIDDPLNLIRFYYDYVEIFNHENGETTLLRMDQIKGFVFEDKPVEAIEDEV